MMQDLIDILAEPISHPFMVRGLIAVTMVEIVCAVVGSYVVIRGLAFFGDALAHAILPGVAIGYLVSDGTQGAIFWWGLATAVLTALGIGFVGRGTKLKEDTAIGVVFAGMFALGIVLISTTRSYALDLAHILFGNVLGVSENDLWLTGILGALVLTSILAFYKELLVLSFDPILAVSLRLPSQLLRYLLLILIALTVVVSLQTVGVGLMVAMLVTPAATAYLLTKRLSSMMVVAVAVGVFSGIAGLYFSYYASVASGAAIVLVCTACFLLTLLLAPQQRLHSIKAKRKGE